MYLKRLSDMCIFMEKIAGSCLAWMHLEKKVAVLLTASMKRNICAKRWFGRVSPWFCISSDTNFIFCSMPATAQWEVLQNTKNVLNHSSLAFISKQMGCSRYVNESVKEESIHAPHRTEGEIFLKCLIIKHISC